MVRRRGAFSPPTYFSRAKCPALPALPFMHGVSHPFDTALPDVLTSAAYRLMSSPGGCARWSPSRSVRVVTHGATSSLTMGRRQCAWIQRREEKFGPRSPNYRCVDDVDWAGLQRLEAMYHARVQSVCCSRTGSRVPCDV
eukprot:3320367-Prymnesium_polylepis.1